jgi:cyclophilin family peptidyl-prolyl cis-trans isomerase
MTATAELAIRLIIEICIRAFQSMKIQSVIAKSILILAALFGAQVATAQDAPQVVAPTLAPSAPATADPENILHLDLSTGGRVTIQLYPKIAPAHVERIKTLARKGFYDGIIFHRVIDGFMAQTGDPTGTGQGDSDLPDLKAEFNNVPHMRGTVSMARTSDENSANSQFFICFQPRLTLDNKYTVFGRVTAGMAFVDKIARGEPPEQPDRIVQASIAADNKPLPTFAPATPAAPTEAPISISE